MKSKDDLLMEQAYSLVKEEQDLNSGTYDEMKQIYGKAKEILAPYKIDNESYFSLIDLFKTTYFAGYKKGSSDREQAFKSAYGL